MTSSDFDMSVAGLTVTEPVKPVLSYWHRRRLLGFGASDVPALLWAVAPANREPPTQHIQKNAAEHTHVVNGVERRLWPRIVLEKAGVKNPLKASKAASIGTAREAELVDTWRRNLTSDDVYDADSVTHASVVPKRFQDAVRDVYCPRLASNLDGWLRDVFKADLVLEAKCGHMERHALPWYWRSQVQAQMACTGASRAVVVHGPMWARSFDVHTTPTHWEVERDESEIAEIRKVVGMCWEWVETIKKGAIAV